MPGTFTDVVELLIPELQRREAFRSAYKTTTLRGHLGLPRPANRYAAAPAPAGTRTGTDQRFEAAS